MNKQLVINPKIPFGSRDLSCTTITSMPFYQNSPVYIQECIPGDKIEMMVNNFVRIEQLASPTFGRVTIRNRVFFVPFRTVWSRFDEFITQQAKDGNYTRLYSVPKLFESNLLFIFAQTSLGFCTLGTNSSYDISVISSTNPDNINYLKFTRKGKFLYRILVNLGYNINFGYRASNTTTNYARQFSALPLFAYYRIWCDFFQFKQSVNYREYDNRIFDSMGGVYVTYNNLIAICNQITDLASLYDDDYFTLAGTSPNIPVYSQGELPNYAYNAMEKSTENFDGITNNQMSVNGSNRTDTTSTTEPILQSAQGSIEVTSPRGISASAIAFLRRAADYFQMKFRGGSTVVQQYLNEYGIELKAEEITHSKHIGSFETPVTIIDVTSTGPVGSGSLGAQSSVARAAGQAKFNWVADEFGYLLVTSVVVAHGQYNHGTPRLATRLLPFDFYHGNFDGLGMQAIRNDEISSGSVTAPSSFYNPDNTFGFVPTYADYKVGHDTLSGNFIVRSTRDAYKSYFLSRWYKPEDYSENPPVAGETFRNPNALQNGWSPTEFDNIFMNPVGDNFNLFFSFTVIARNNVKPFMDNYDWYADGERRSVQGGINAFGDN